MGCFFWEIVEIFGRPFLSCEFNFFSADGSKIVSSSWDKTIKLWDVTFGKLLKTLEGHSSYVYSACFSPDGSWIASGSFDRTIKLWVL